jgi:uncharacterized protein YrrD
MLRSMRDLENYSIRATDGDIGCIKDFYFDDSAWVIRYLIVDTHGWIHNRKVLISPLSMGRPDWGGKILPVKITKEQVRDSPDIHTDKSVSRQHEMRYLGYYGYSYYWGRAGLWGESAYPHAMLNEGDDARSDDLDGGWGEQALSGSGRHKHDDAPLRSCKEVIGYHLHAADGDIGHVYDLLIDERTWVIRYIVVNTSNWFGGHQVLIVPHQIGDVSSTQRIVSADLTRQRVKDAPPYDAGEAFCLQEEESIWRHYGRNGYCRSMPKDQVKRPSR